MMDLENIDLTENVQTQLMLNKVIPDNLEANSDKNKDICNTEAPDGGVRAWMVMVASFFCKGIIFGVFTSYSVLYPEILSNLKATGISEASSKAALVGSLTIGTTLAASSIGSILMDRIGIRRTTLIGGVLAIMGLFCSSFLVNSLQALYITYSVLFGLGTTMIMTPSLAILNHYFHKYLGLVNGIVTMGGSIFTVVMPFITEKVFKSTSLEQTLRVFAACMVCITFSTVIYKPLPSRIKPKAEQSSFKGLVNVSIWKNKRFLLWTLITTFSVFGYFGPYVHMMKIVEESFPDQDGKLPFICIGITNALGCLLFGYISDLPKVGRILLQQISFLAMGIAIICLPFCSSFLWILVVTSVLGFFDGGYVALIAPNAFDICGPDDAAQAIGFNFTFNSIPVILGPPIIGLLYDRTNSYQLPLIVAGMSFILGSVALFLIRCVKIPLTEN